MKVNSLFKLCFLLLFGFYLPVAFAKHQSISYTDAGKGEPLVLIHAFPTDKTLWKPQQEYLQFQFRVITLDLWGFGHADTTNGKAITMTAYADEVKQLLDQLQIQKAIIGGESMGGYIALAFLEKYPENVSGLILSGTQSVADSPETKTKREANAINVMKNGTGELIRDFMTKALSPTATDETRAQLKDIVEKQPPYAIASALRGMALRPDTTHVLANTSLPILILTGDKDTLISPQQSQNMQAAAKNSRLVVIDNAGHLSNLEQPEQWNKAVIEMFYKKNNNS